MKLFFSLACLAFFAARATAAVDPSSDTTVECVGLFETVSTDTEITSTFRDKVVVTGNNLRLTCDFLTVIAIRKGDKTAAIGKYGYFKSLVATGHVRIVQGDREALCGRAQIFPGEDKIVLSENPSVRSTDDQYAVTGPILELYRGQRRVVIPAQPDGPGTRITLPALKDLGYDKNQEKEKENSPPTNDGGLKAPPAK